MSDSDTAAGVAGFKDRKTGLMVFGILEIILGSIFALFAPLMVVGAFLASFAGSLSPQGATPPPVNVPMMLSGVLVYALMAVTFIWLGIGSLKARRWARALWLIISWVWLVSGIGGMVFVLAFLPDMFGSMNAAAPLPPAAQTIMKTAFIGFMTVFYILIPGSLVLFYRRRDVKLTCEARDPQVRWTDRCPLPVLGISVMAATSAAWMPVLGLFGWAMPFFGIILGGYAGMAVFFVMIVLLAYISWKSYHLKVEAWWCATGLIVLWGVSTAVTFSRMSLLDFYERMQFPAEQLEQMEQMGLPQGNAMIAFSLAWVVVMLAYLAYARRFFGPRRTDD